MSQNLQLTLGESPSGNVEFDLHLLLRTRLLLAASSGAGKSETIRKLCELCAGHVQIIVIDPEGEFAGMRTTLPFVLAGSGGEAAATVKTAPLLARRLLELNASAVCDIYELPPAQRHEFVRDFLVAMIDAPKNLWHPVLVIVDESHIYAPEKGESPSVAGDAMADMASRGRKRGYCIVLATQRVSKLNNNVAALCENILVGRTTQIDQSRAAKMLNIAGNSNVAEFSKAIGRVKDGQFFAWGRAFGLEEPTLFQVSRPAGAMSSAKALLAPPPAPAAIRDMLPKLADLPQEAERKAKSEDDLRNELKSAHKRIKELESSAPATPTVDEETVKMLKEKLATLSDSVDALQRVAEEQEARDERVREMLRELVTIMAPAGISTAHATASKARGEAKRIVNEIPAQVMPRKPCLATVPPSDGEPLSGPEQRILNALAWMESIGVDEPEQPAVAFLAGYTYGSGGYNNPRGRLRQRGLIEYIPGDHLKLSAAGKKSAEYPDIEPTNEALHSAILGKLPGPEGRILSVLLKHYPKSMDSTKLAEASGYTPGSGGFNNPRGRLKTLGLVEYPSPGMVIAKDLLFPEGR